jgi:zinc transporter ZupT
LDKEEVEPSEFLSRNDLIDTEGLGRCIGISIASGFTLMLLFDELWSKKKKTLDFDQMRIILNNDSLDAQTKQAQIESLSKDEESSAYVTTMGLVIHSISDGIALGVSLFFSMLFS